MLHRFTNVGAAALTLCLITTPPAQSYKPFKAKPSCTIAPNAAQSQFCDGTSQTITITLSGTMGDDATGPYAIRVVDKSETPDGKLIDGALTNPGFPAAGKLLSLRLKITLKCGKSVECKCPECGGSVESFEWTEGTAAANNGWKDMKGNVLAKVDCNKGSGAVVCIDFGDAANTDNLDCSMDFKCVCAPEGFGFGCPGTQGLPGILASGYPDLGTNFGVLLNSGAPQSQAVLVLGLSRSQWKGLALPFALGHILPGSTCVLLASPDLTLTATTDAHGGARAALPLPRDPALIGARLYSQWAVLDPQAPWNLSMTSGLQFQIRG